MLETTLVNTERAWPGTSARARVLTAARSC